MEGRQYFDETKKRVLRTPRRIHYMEMRIIRCHKAFKILIGCTYRLAKLKALLEKEIRESLEINHLEVNTEFY